MGLEKVVDGVWLLRGDFRGAMNIYFLEDGDGVVQFDAVVRIDTPGEADYYRNGGIMQYVLRNLLAGAA